MGIFESPLSLSKWYAATAVVIALAASPLVSGTRPLLAQVPSPPVNVTVGELAVWLLQPSAIVLQVGETQQFTAFVPNEFRTMVRWWASVGTVSADGLYTAPSTPGTYVVTAEAPGGRLVANAVVDVVARYGTTTVAADRFVDSVGVNIHLHYDRTLYRDNFDLVKTRLLELGVRHVRDGMINTSWRGYYERHEALGEAGIKGVFIVDPSIPTAVIQNYPSLVPSSFEAYEAPNEFDSSSRPNWAGLVRDTLTRLQTMKTIPALAKFPIYGPSLTRESSYATLGDVSRTIDRANLHDYFAGRHPGTGGWGNNGYGSIPWNLNLLRRYSGGKPIVATETGYLSGTSGVDVIPDAVAGKYMPRVLLEHFRAGISRTYLYELCDQFNDTYGLLTSDGRPKPAFRSVRNLIAVLSDSGPVDLITPLRYVVSGGGADLRHMVFQKRDGSYQLALWLESSGYDVPTKRVLDVASQNVIVRVEGGERLVRTRAWQLDGNIVTTAVTPSSQSTIAVTDRLLMLEYRR